MRGTHSSIAVEGGSSAHMVAASLGHTSPTITMNSYVKKSAADNARVNRTLTVLAGGRDR